MTSTGDEEAPEGQPHRQTDLRTQLAHQRRRLRKAEAQTLDALTQAGHVAKSVVTGPVLTNTPPAPIRPRRARRLRRESWAFATGALLFFVGAVMPAIPNVTILAANVTQCVGSVFFTLGALIQLLLSGRRPPARGSDLANRADWWSAAVQLLGTLFFNVSTTMAVVVSAQASGATANGWRPDAVGSVMFLLSSALGVVATTQRRELWDPLARTWRSTWLNMLGSIAFGIAAVFAFPASFADLRALDIPNADLWSAIGTALGAVGFFAAAALARRSVEIYPKLPDDSA